jgi:ribonuclease D
MLDLKYAPPTPEIPDALRSSRLIIHNAAFDMRFLCVKLGVVPENVFCTLTASRLLTPSNSVHHDLGSLLECHLGVKIPKELGASDWGAPQLMREQIDYAENDVRHLHDLAAKLEAKLEAAKLTKVSSLKALSCQLSRAWKPMASRSTSQNYAH